MKEKVYLETTIPGCLTVRPGRNVVLAGRQRITREWWDHRRSDFALFISPTVVEEISRGDPKAAKERLDLVHGISVLELNAESMSLARRLQKRIPLPQKAEADAFHIAIAAVHAMDYLLTWNCTHIANAALRKPIELICRQQGFRCPIICTPAELLGG